MFDEGVEISIAVEKGEAVFDAERRDHRVDGLPHGDPQRSEKPKIDRGLEGQIFSAQVHDLERGEKPPRRVESAVCREALQNLGEDQIADHQGFRTQTLVELFDLRG